jgi:hypothetical protein
LNPRIAMIGNDFRQSPSSYKSIEGTSINTINGQ